MWFLGETVGVGINNFGLLRGIFFVLPHVSVLKILRIFVENSTMGEKYNKTFGPRPDLRIGHWLMGA